MAQECSSLKFSISFLQNEQAFEEIFQNANFRSFVFKIRVKLETYNVSRVTRLQKG